MPGYYSRLTREMKCLNCGDVLDNNVEEFCSRACELEALYEEQATCKSCGGDGRGEENLKGEIGPCRRCYGTGYIQ